MGGREKRSEADMQATVKVVRRIVEVEIVGGEETSIEDRIVKIARSTPAASVVVASDAEIVRGDAVGVLVPSDRRRDQGLGVEVGEETFEFGRDVLGSGGCRNRTEVARAR
jgi:hypothetical protein